jgi:hypothetical protein
MMMLYNGVLTLSKKIIAGVFELAKFTHPNDMTVPREFRESYSEFEFGGTEIKCRNYKNETTKEIAGYANVKYH